jgi:hypothetical protein
MVSKLQVFVSSTFQDLKEERQAAVEAILKSGHIPAGMELFTAGDKSQLEVIQRWIMDSDVYMLILGGRYGSIESTSGLSYTELEYYFAVAKNKPHFAVVISEDAIEARVQEHGSAVLERDCPDKLKAFRKKVLQKMSSFFTDTKDVKLSVHETLPRLETEYELKGWVRAAEVPDTKSLADELSKLSTENRALREQISALSKKAGEQRSVAATGEREFQELVDVMSDITINMSALKRALTNSKNPDAANIPNETSLIDLAVRLKDALMLGVTNQRGVDDVESYIFYQLCPKLQTYDLIQSEKVAGAQYRRYSMTKKGTQFFAFIEKKVHGKKNTEQGNRPATK